MSYKVLQSNPAAGTLADLYVVPAGKEAVISTLSVSEHESLSSVFSVLIRPAGAAAASEHIFINAGQLLANESQFYTLGIALAEGDVISVESNKSNTTFMCFARETAAV